MKKWSPEKMKIDNSVKQWQAYCITKSGKRIEWHNLRHRQAKWRFDMLRKRMLFNDEWLLEAGYKIKGRV